MNIRKAVITAAGTRQRSLPLQTLVDRDGEAKSALRIILEEILSTGVEEIGVVIAPGDAPAYAEAAGSHSGRLTFIEQAAPRGYGHALLEARAFVDDKPFLHLVSDHLYVSAGTRGCARQLVETASEQACAVSAVEPTREGSIGLYGTIGAQPVAGATTLYEIESVREKPTPTLAEQELVVPGMRIGHYLCFFGMHVLTPTIMELLAAELAAAGPDQTIQLSPALDRLAACERYLALRIEGHRYNIGLKYGLFLAQFALALRGDDRETVLAELVELLATRPV